MQLSRLAFLLGALVIGTQAVAISIPRQLNGCSCGRNTYDNGYIDSSISDATNGGAGKYPHKYNDFEGFTFDRCGGSAYYEYPLIVGDVPYDGSSPGPDRVVYDDSGNFCACLTHTGASRNNFLECNF